MGGGEGGGGGGGGEGGGGRGGEGGERGGGGGGGRGGEGGERGGGGSSAAVRVTWYGTGVLTCAAHGSTWPGSPPGEVCTAAAGAWRGGGEEWRMSEMREEPIRDEGMGVRGEG